jgi:uncharacterized protein YoxC
MDASSVLDIALPVVFAVVGLALVWLLVELVKTVKVARKTVEDMKAQLTPTLQNVDKIVADITPAVAKVDPLVERVQLTVDAANLELMRIDSILEDVNGVTGTLANTSAAIDNVTSAPLNMVNAMTDRLRGVLRGRHSSATSADLAEAAAQAQISSQAEAAAQAAAQSDEDVLSDEGIAQAMGTFAAAAADNALEDTSAEQGLQYYTYGAPASEEPAAEPASEQPVSEE